MVEGPEGRPGDPEATARSLRGGVTVSQLRGSSPGAWRVSLTGPGLCPTAGPVPRPPVQCHSCLSQRVLCACVWVPCAWSALDHGVTSPAHEPQARELEQVGVWGRGPDLSLTVQLVARQSLVVMPGSLLWSQTQKHAHLPTLRHAAKTWPTAVPRWSYPSVSG